MPSTSRSRGSGRGPDGAPKSQVIAPMSERQQLALVMQISSQDALPAAPTPAEERKRTRQQRNERGETPLHVAAIRGDHEQVKKYLDQGQDPDVADFAGWTALHEACIYGWLQVVTVLVEGHANVNAKGLDDNTPLHDATTSGNLKLVKFLIEHGGDPFAKNKKGKTPADYAVPHIFEYLQSLKDNARATHTGRTRDDSAKKVCNANSNSDFNKRSNMESLAQGDHFEGKEAASQEKGNVENRDDGAQLSSGVVSSTQDEVVSSSNKRPYVEDSQEAEPAEDELSKRKKRKDNEEKEPMAKPAPVARGGTGRILTGSKPPGPASKTGAAPLKSGAGQSTGKVSGASSSGKGVQAQGKGGGAGGKAAQSHQGKSGTAKGASSSQASKQDRKSPVASPKPHQGKDNNDDEEQKAESTAPKVPPLKIVIPGGASGSGSRNEQEGEGGTGQRGSGKGRGSASTLPYVIPCTSTDTGQTSDSSDGNCDDKRTGESSKGQDGDHAPSTSSGSGGRNEAGPSVELHPRKRKLKASRDNHSREPKVEAPDSTTVSHNITHSNPYQMYIHIRKQIERRQKGLFPVKPKPPKDFNKYLMNRCTYTLQNNVNPEPQVDIPHNMPSQMVNEFMTHEKERMRLRIQHLVEKEKLVLAVEQEILRVHGRAERAVANQSLPFSVCTILRDKEVYNVQAPDQEEKRNAQRSRCNGRQINSWLQEVDDKWEKIKMIPVTSFGLGCWQVYRLQWKLELIEILQAKSNAPPVEMPEDSEKLESMEYRPVKVKGEFLHDKEILIGPRALIENDVVMPRTGSLISDPKKNQGWLVITPFKLSDSGKVILVNRGWIPQSMRPKEKRQPSLITGEVELTGILRLTEARSPFMPKNNPEKGSWLYRDLDQMSAYLSSEPIWLDAKGIPDPPAGWPLPNQTRVTLRNEHVSYLVTWYLLSAFTGTMWHRYFIRKLPLL
ncbi:protein phosphatase 1 regulatory subunit 12A-like isoform X3 [Maniola hyperantus]|uniref:protein phosphatase 1 regulatory subunit 12A-like isoform X3 n=1 Tax=Aphantopus hyperantus TaxID=2795564 RepID=UPI003748F6A2